MPQNLRVTVLRGGPSAEREVSLASGAAVAAACRRLGYSVSEADIDPGDLTALDRPADVVFPVLHGTFGEDGQLQAILDARGLPYVGSQATASQWAMDKEASKRAWRDAGLPTAPWTIVDLTTGPVLPKPWAPPLVLKPVNQGSSIGVVLVRSERELPKVLDAALREYGRVLVEPLLVGPELTIGILGRETLPMIQVKAGVSRFFDYEAKYHRDDTAYLFEPEIETPLARRLEEGALAAFDTLGCRHLGRVDLIVDQRTGPQLLEINTLPGFTDHSLLPMAAARAGLGFDQLVERLVGLARPGCVGSF